MSKKKEYKSFEIKLEDEPTDSGIIKGHAAVFGNIDLGNEVIDKGAFRKTLREKGANWPILKDHSSRNRIGTNLKGKEDKVGLAIEEQLNLEDPEARSTFGLVKQVMDINSKGGKASAGLSIGFFTVKSKEEIINKIAIRRLKEIEMMEHSHVTFPMNTSAMAVDAKDLNLELKDRVDEFYRFMESIGYTQSHINEALKLRAAYPETESDADQKRILHSISSFRQIIKGE